jgi:thiosulfate reductase cytochrome b subunit
MRGGYDRRMGIPVSLLLIAGGAILAFAVEATSSAVNIHAVGWILMAAGLLGLLLSMILWDSWGGGRWRHDARPAAPAPRRPPRP